MAFSAGEFSTRIFVYRRFSIETGARWKGWIAKYVFVTVPKIFETMKRRRSTTFEVLGPVIANYLTIFSK